MVDQIQLGNNGTPANNFVIKTLNDGTMKIQRGNIGGSLVDLLTIDINGVVSPAKFDLGQTWQLMGASRVLGTTYTNSTGKPIQVAIVNSNAATMTLTIGGGVIVQQGAPSASFGTLTALVPPGATYSVSGGVLFTWYELR